jgi:prevent-host-death family protein
MADRVIPQRALRNHITEILRDAEAGAEFMITVRGRPVAKLGPADDGRRRTNVSAETIRAALEQTPVDSEFATDIQRIRELEVPIEPLSDQ